MKTVRFIFVILLFLITNNSYAQEFRLKGASYGSVEANGDVRINGLLRGRFERNGDISGTIDARINSDGTIRKKGRVVGKVDSYGNVTVDGVIRGKVEDNGDVLEYGTALGTAPGIKKEQAAVIFFFKVF